MDKKQTVIAFGGVAGFVNTDVELKKSPSGSEYVNVLLGQGKDNQGSPRPSFQITLFGKEARAFVQSIKKGDLVRFTSISLAPVIEQDKNHSIYFRLVGQTFEKIERTIC